jgi:hypothetical protein
MSEQGGVKVRFSPDAPPRVPYHEPKFYELVLYVADAFKNDPKFGRIKLAKLIFNIDRRSMRQLNRPITGVTYRKDTWGHNPVQLLLAELDLAADEAAEIVIGEGEEEPRFIRHDDRRRLVPKRPGHPDLSPEEQEIVDGVLAEFRDTPAKALSDESHKTLGWQIAEMRAEIPIESVLVEQPTERDLAQAQATARRIGFASD